jgi:hypothetical protein
MGIILWRDCRRCSDVGPDPGTGTLPPCVATRGARIAAAGGAGRRSANIAAAPMHQSRVAHHPARPLHTDLAAPAQNAAIAVLRTVECARDDDPRLAKGVGDLSLDAFEAYVDLRWGQGLVYDAGFV